VTSRHIIIAGVAVAVVVAVVVFGREGKAIAAGTDRAWLEKLYGRKIPVIPPGMSWNPITGQLQSMSNATTGKLRF